MTYEDFMSLGLLPDSTPSAQPPAQRDTLSEAFKLQMLLNLAFGEMAEHEAPEAQEEDELNTLTAERGFAGHMAQQALYAPPEPSSVYVAEPRGMDAAGMLFGDDSAEPPMEDMAAGRPTAPDFGLFGQMPMPMPPTQPDASFAPATMNGLADALGPDVSSVSRLGGPFAGYTPDMLTRRLQELVRRVH